MCTSHAEVKGASLEPAHCHERSLCLILLQIHSYENILFLSTGLHVLRIPKDNFWVSRAHLGLHLDSTLNRP
jgi:hypothetical protein